MADDIHAIAPAAVSQADLDKALAELARIEADSKFRGERPGRYRSALVGARAKVERIATQLNARVPGSGPGFRSRRTADV
ncbi:hypothetical protein [Chthonobacter albigriseus]|uniref:hypothetical protein n=1 Tax=Chthonobacter albigriseus TaxID=1683161 RepID=UPI0015EF5EF6|nr:hypothetical protein [Chthonobacter albigriseus]